MLAIGRRGISVAAEMWAVLNAHRLLQGCGFAALALRRYDAISITPAKELRSQLSV